MSAHLLGLDCGLTVTKAVVHDADGRLVGRAEARVPHASPHPRWVERDVDALWLAAAGVIRRAVADARVSPRDIAGIGVTGHGDGVYLVDEAGRAVRPAILSLDTRAVDVVAGWRAAGVMERALALTGQTPWPATPAAVLAWLASHEPDALRRAASVLGAKDFLRLRLTGVAGTDPSEASLSFTDVRSQAYSFAALDLYGLADLVRLLPVVVPSAEIAGAVTPEAAAACGLAPGIPVVTGIHDVDACAIGTGAVGEHVMSVIAGSFSINQVVADQPHVDPRWSCRSFGEPGRWMHMAVSPASATNLEWFARLLGSDVEAGFAFVDSDMADVEDDPREIVYLPFLYGSPVSDAASAAFVGMRGWHRRAHLLRALLEGVVFNHRWHVEALGSAFPSLGEGRLTGGGSRSRAWVQRFADGLGMPMVLTDTDEAGALGAAMLAGIGAGAYAGLDDAIARAVRVRSVVEPTAAGLESMAAGYARYRALIAALGPVWDAAAG